MANKVELVAAKPRHDLADVLAAMVAGLGLTMAVLFLCVVPFSGHLAGSRDFVSYWATGQQLVRHGNPYDHDSISSLEHAAGLDTRAVLIMRNPPWALPLAYPLGFVGPKFGAVLWSSILLGCLVLSVKLVRQLHGSPPGYAHWLALGFTPALICLTMGQTSLFALFGLVLFLRYHAERPFLAGVALWLCLLKPHLFVPFAAALCLWMLSTRAWKVLAGTAAAIASSSVVAWVVDPHAWSGYVGLMRSPSVENEFIPCLADAIRLWLRPQAVWLQYLPTVLCSVWAAVYFWRRRSIWNWATHGSMLMLVSLVAAPYCWLYDQCLAIPGLLCGAFHARDRRLLSLLASLILAADLQLAFVKVISPWWLWTAPAWFAWFLLAMHSRKIGIRAEDANSSI